MDCIHRLDYKGLIGGFPSEEMIDCISLGFLCTSWYNGRNCITTGWMVRMDRMVRGWDGGWDGGTDVSRRRGSATSGQLEVEQQEVVTATNCVGAIRVQSIFFKAAKYSNRLHTNPN